MFTCLFVCLFLLVCFCLFVCLLVVCCLFQWLAVLSIENEVAHLIYLFYLLSTDREHIVDMLPLVWMLDGRLISG